MNAAVFLDRDGTLGGSGGFCHPDDFRMYDAVPAAIRLLNDAAIRVVLVTNQVRIGTGEITIAQLESSFLRMQRELATCGAHVDAWYYCPHLPEDECDCRKPKPGMLHRAARELGLDLAQSYMIGDTGASDMKAGAAAGCRCVLVLTGFGQGSMSDYRGQWAEVQPEYVARDVLDAVRHVLDTSRCCQNTAG